MAGLICGHDVRTRPGLAALFDQVGKRLVNQGLYLPTLLLSDRPDGRQNIRIDLRREFLTGHIFRIMTNHDMSRDWQGAGAEGQDETNRKERPGVSAAFLH